MLSLVDIKDGVLNNLLKRKNIIVNVVLIIFVSVVGLYIHSLLSRINKNLKAEIILEKKKNDLMKKIAMAERNVSDYKGLLTQKEITLVINTITSIAQDSGVKIVSVRPDREQHYPIYAKTSIKLSLLADSYQDIINFINELETSPDLYKVVNLGIKKTKPSTGGATMQATEGEETPALSLELEIIRLRFKG